MAMDLTKKIQFVLGVSGDDKVKTAMKGVTDGMWDTEKAVGIAKTALVGLIGITSVNAFKTMVMGAIDATGALHDMSIQTGMSVAALQAFKGIGSYTSTSIDTIAAASNKLSKTLATQSEDSKGAAQAIQALGLNFDEFKRLSPEQQMLTVAKAMGNFADGSGKSAAAMMLFGKQGAELLPFFGDLADDADKVTAALTEQNVATRAAQAAMADAFGDNLTALRKNSEGWKKDLAMGLLPALYEGSEALKAMMSGTNGLSAEVSRLAKDGTLAEWARGAATAFSYLVDIGQGLFTLLPMIGHVVAGVAAGTSTLFGAIFEAMQRLKSGDISGAWDAIKAGMSGVRTVAGETAQSIGELWGQKLLGSTFRERMADLQGVTAAAQAAKPALNIREPLDENAKAAERHAKAVQSLTGNLDELIDRQQQELTQGTELTEVDKLMVKMRQQLSGAELAGVAVKLKLAKTQEAEIKAMKDANKWMDESGKANDRVIDGINRHTEQLWDQIRAQNEQTYQLGLSATQMQKHENAALRDAAAEKLRLAAVLQGVDSGAADAYRREAQALTELADARDRYVSAKGAQEMADAYHKTADSIAEGLTNAFMRGIGSGKSMFVSLRDYVVDLFAQKVVAASISNFLSGLLGGTDAGLAGNGTGGTGILQYGQMLSSAYSYGSKAWSYGSSLFGSAGAAGSSAYSLAGASGSLGASSGSGLYALGSGGTGSGLSVTAGTAADWGITAGAGEAAASGSAAGSSAWASAGAYAGYAALAAAAVYLSSRWYDQGYTGSERFGGIGDQNGAGLAYQLSGTKEGKQILSALGVSEKWAEVLSGSVGLNYLFDKVGLLKTPHVGGYSLASGSGVEDITRQQGGIQNATMQEWTDSFAKDMLTLITGVAEDFGAQSNAAGLRSVYESDNRDGSWGLFQILDKDGQIIASHDSLGTLDRDPAKGFAQYADSAAVAIRDALLQVDIPQWAKKQLELLTSASTLQDLGSKIAEIEAYRNALNEVTSGYAPLGGIFAKLAAASSDAQNSVIQLAGGLDAFSKKASDYVSNYYSEQEQMAVAAKQLLEQSGLMGLDLGGFESRGDLRALMDSYDPLMDAEKIASLLDVSGAYANIADYLQKNSITLAELADQAPQVAAMDALKTPAETTADATQRTADELAALNERVDALTEALAESQRQTAEAVRQLNDTVTRTLDNGGGLDVRIVP